MDSRIFSNKRSRINQAQPNGLFKGNLIIHIINQLLPFLILCIVIGLSGCSFKTVVTDDPGQDEIPAPEMVAKQPDSRMIASHSLTREGYAFLNNGDYNGAIRILERAISINPSDGPGYYYLAEAWVGKNNYNLALQFNRLAGIYLRKDSHWNQLALDQKTRIKDYINRNAK